MAPAGMCGMAKHDYTTVTDYYNIGGIDPDAHANLFPELAVPLVGTKVPFFNKFFPPPCWGKKRLRTQLNPRRSAPCTISVKKRPSGGSGMGHRANLRKTEAQLEGLQSE
eukprot:1141190-Pelagomonas_calceolata.AAC.7